jgi:hypothetical protein
MAQEEKFIKIVLTAGCKLMCSPLVFKHKHEQYIKRRKEKKYEEVFFVKKGAMWEEKKTNKKGNIGFDENCVWQW